MRAQKTNAVTATATVDANQLLVALSRVPQRRFFGAPASWTETDEGG